MLSSREELTPTGVIRSMERLGFSKEEIYDTLTGTGIPGGEVQLLLDRIEADFEGTEFKSRTSRLAEEVEKALSNNLEEAKVELNSKLQNLNRNIKSTESGLERLESRVIELQSLIVAGARGKTEDG